MGHFHTGIRWFNVLLVCQTWTLIDCYDFSKAADHEQRLATKRLRSAGSADAKWCAVDDLAQVVALADAEQFRDEKYNVFAGVRAIAEDVAAGVISVDEVIDLVDQVDV